MYSLRGAKNSQGLGFAPAATAAALSLGPVGWIAAGVASVLPFLRFGAPRGNYQRFESTVAPELRSLAGETEIPAMRGWFGELVGVEPDGTRKIYGTWATGEQAVAQLMDLGARGPLWAYSDPGQWILIGPWAPGEIGDGRPSKVWQILPTIAEAIRWFREELPVARRAIEEMSREPEELRSGEPQEPRREPDPPPGVDRTVIRTQPFVDVIREPGRDTDWTLLALAALALVYLSRRRKGKK
jgi:hypothetical protein